MPPFLSKYVIGRTLGEGNFGKVKYARHVESGLSFAIKILDLKRIQSLDLHEQIKREIATLKLLKHPNVVRLYEIGRVPPGPLVGLFPSEARGLRCMGLAAWAPQAGCPLRCTFGAANATPVVHRGISAT